MKTLATWALAIAACGGAPPPPAPAPAPAPNKPAEPPAASEPAKPPEPAKPDPARRKAELASAETAAYEAARPVFAKHCASCHTTKGAKATKKKLDHFSMDGYPFGGEHATSIGNEIRVVLAIDGNKKATMPSDKPGSVTGDDLAAIKAWTEAWLASGAAGNHPIEPAERDDD